MEDLFLSGVGDLAEAVLEFGDVVVWVLRLLFDGAEPSSVLDVGTTERAFFEPVRFELLPVWWVCECVEISCGGIFHVEAYPS